MKVKLNSYGYQEVALRPTNEELKSYYSQKYYQESKSTYEKSYSSEEIDYFNNKIEQREFVLETRLKMSSSSGKSLLDIGSGEGWVLNYYKKRGWRVTGLDFSDYGCRNFNPGCMENVIVGDIYESIELLKNKLAQFSVIWLDNVLEHVTHPYDLLVDCRRLIAAQGALIVEVPNDFSQLQQYLLKRKHITSEFWVVLPDHLSYFNKNGLLNLAKAAGWEIVFTMADFPIDFFLANPDTNYVNDKTKGKNCHRARVELDNLMHSISVEKTVAYYEALGSLGLGRQIIAFLRPIG